MILVTGATGCVGRAVVERLVNSGHAVKCLFHWGHEHPAPRRVVITGGDVRNQDSIYEALTDGGECDTIVHLAFIRRETKEDKFEEVNIRGTENVIDAAKRAKVQRLIMVGCLGAEVRSPFPHLRSLGIAEERVRQSGLNFTVLKSAVIYGEGDWLTHWLNQIARNLPLVMPLPHGGYTKLQPIWVGDVAACIARSLELRSTFRQVITIGGPQALTLADIAKITLKAKAEQRRLVRVPTPLTHYLVSFLSRFQDMLSEPEMDALSYNRTAEIGSVHRTFGFAPVKMVPERLAYLSPGYQPPPPPVRFKPRSPAPVAALDPASSQRMRARIRALLGR
ncbi:MAG: NAD-dependent epimerase/dehydratase family protein [Thermoflexales bacterium]